MALSSGDRHLRTDSRVRLGALRPSPRRVVVATDAAGSRTFAAQAVLALAVDLVARMFGVVEAVSIDVPSAPVIPGAFPRPGASGTGLDERLLDVARRVSGGEIEVVADRAAAGDILVWSGHGPAPRHEGLVVRAHGDGFAAFCSTERAAPAVAPRRLEALGPHLAACLAADRVFRHLRSLDVTGTFEVDLSTLGAPAWSSAERSQDLVVPPAYLVGLGAVGGAYLYTAAASRNLNAALVGIDPDIVDPTSRNRLLTAEHADVGARKADLGARLAAGSGVAFHPNRAYLAEYLVEAGRSLPAALLATESLFRYEYVLSCVDRNTSRRDIAALQPRHVVSGSTDGLRAESTYYSHAGACECLACNHPVLEADMRDMADELASLGAPERAERLRLAGASPEAAAAIEDFLEHRRCGSVGETELRRLGAAIDGPEWSVGFVSAAAGVLLAARHITLVRSGPPAAAEFRLYFTGAGSVSSSTAQRKPTCDVCGPADAQARFARRWGGSG